LISTSMVSIPWSLHESLPNYLLKPVHFLANSVIGPSFYIHMPTNITYETVSKFSEPFFFLLCRVSGVLLPTSALKGIVLEQNVTSYS
jgi:hypothetical protein